MYKLTCITCGVCLPSSDDQREHYKGEWHIYNLKRKLNQLACIPREEFESIKQQHTQTGQDQAKLVALENEISYCNVCHKSFNTKKAFDQHNSSKKHLTSLTQVAEKAKGSSGKQAQNKVKR